MPDSPASPVFREVQRMPAWLAILCIGSTAVAALGALAALSGSDRLTALPVALGGLALVVLLFEAMKMHTVVDGGTLVIRSLRLVRREFPLDEIASAQPVTYSPLRDYGGWGIRRSRNGRAYNMRGNRGVQLVLRSGERVLIGSQHPEALAAALAG